MKLKTYFAIAGIVAILFGLEFLLVPGYSLRQYAVPTDAHNLMQAMFFGSALLTFGLVVWLARGTRDEIAQRAILVAAVVGDFAGVVISVWAALSGLQNAMAWSSVVIYALFVLGAVYFLAFPARRG
jgi:FtsH-binding integral membrane protein